MTEKTQPVRKTTRKALDAAAQDLNRAIESIVNAAVEDGEIPPGTVLVLDKLIWRLPDITPAVSALEHEKEPAPTTASSG